MVQTDTIEYYTIVINAYVETSKHEKTPFDPTIILKIIKNFEYILSHNITPPYNFYNLLYILMEEQELSGFNISPFLKKIIKLHRKENPISSIMYCIEFAYIEIIKRLIM